MFVHSFFIFLSLVSFQQFKTRLRYPVAACVASADRAVSNKPDANKLHRLRPALKPSRFATANSVPLLGNPFVHVRVRPQRPGNITGSKARTVTDHLQR